MKKFISLFFCLAFVSLRTPIFAENVPANTSIFITPKEFVSSKDNSIDSISAEITNDVVINNVVVFKSGDKATLHIGEIEKARCWGKAGKLVVNNGFAYEARGNKHKILFSKNYYGEEKMWPKTCGVISIFFLFPLALFGFVQGGEARVASNNEIETYLASPFKF